ncbi:MAG: NAD(P)-dependent glycerol-1-phosphate dehydrogenase [Crenarchaeota archaeon]|nr:NAD(P)-dependent glycerol-1-phosphate dehydrogenase [Thermoproteota archaeon]
MLERHEIDLMKRVVVGKGTRTELAKILKSLGYDGKVLVVTGPNVWSEWGDEVQGVLESGGYRVEYVTVREPTVEEAQNVMRKINFEPSVIVGFGGGKSIDIAKYVALKLNRDVVSLPSTTSHDGIASPFSSLRGLNGPTSMRTKTPIAVVADTEVIARAPERLNRAGIGDVLAKFSAVRDWRLAHVLKGEYYGSYAASLALMSARHVLKYVSLLKGLMEEGLRILVEALISSGVAMCIAGSSRPASGSEHLFSHALDIIANRPALHGEQVGVGTIMMLYLHGTKLWRKVRKVLKTLNLPTTAEELGVSDDKVVEALMLAPKIRPERYTILGSDGLTREAAENLARVTGVIN